MPTLAKKKPAKKKATTKKSPTKRATKAKPKAKAKPRAKKSNPDLVDDTGMAVVKGDLLWKYRAISAEWNEAQALLREASVKRTNLYMSEECTPLRLADSAIKQQQVENAGKTAELQAVQNEIAKRFGMENLQNCAIDSTSGRIYILEAQGDGVQKAATPRTLKLEEKRRKLATAETKKVAAGKRITKKK